MFFGSSSGLWPSLAPIGRHLVATCQQFFSGLYEDYFSMSNGTSALSRNRKALLPRRHHLLCFTFPLEISLMCISSVLPCSLCGATSLTFSGNADRKPGMRLSIINCLAAGLGAGDSKMGIGDSLPLSRQEERPWTECRPSVP